MDLSPREIVKELDRVPITIKTLNIRVDTARDLTLKLYIQQYLFQINPQNKHLRQKEQLSCL